MKRLLSSCARLPRVGFMVGVVALLSSPAVFATPLTVNATSDTTVSSNHFPADPDFGQAAILGQYIELLLTAVENGGAGRSKMVALGGVDLP